MTRYVMFKCGMAKMGPNDTCHVVWALGDHLFFSFVYFRY